MARSGHSLRLNLFNDVAGASIYVRFFDAMQWPGEAGARPGLWRMMVNRKWYPFDAPAIRFFGWDEALAVLGELLEAPRVECAEILPAGAPVMLMTRAGRTRYAQTTCEPWRDRRGVWRVCLDICKRPVRLDRIVPEGETMPIIDDVLKLLGQGWLAYQGPVDGSVYDKADCRKRKDARWFVKDGQHLCIGCRQRCLHGAEGFQVMGPSPGPFAAVYADVPAISAEELLRKKMFLNPQETMFVLNLRRQKLYDLLDEGRLQRHPDLPLRFTAASIRNEVERSNQGEG